MDVIGENADEARYSEYVIGLIEREGLEPHYATIRKGDTVVVYHTGDEKQAVGLAVAASDAYPDPKLKNPKRPVVDLAADRALPRPVTLSAAKADAVLKGTELARLPRLSVMPFTEAQFQRLLRMAGA